MPFILVDKNNKPVIDPFNFNRYNFNDIQQLNTKWFDETSKEYLECIFYNNKQDVKSLVQNVYNIERQYIKLNINKQNVKIIYNFREARNILNDFILQETTQPFPRKFFANNMFFEVKNKAQCEMIIATLIENSGLLFQKAQDLTAEIEAVKTQKALSKYTQEYLQAEFDKINKTIIID